MKEILIKAEHEYAVCVGANWRETVTEISKNYSKVLILAPRVIVEALGLKSLESKSLAIFTLPEGEDQKSAKTLEEIWSHCAQISLTRKDVIVAIGGGATTDIGGFAAATWLRGIDWYAIPTTVAGMVDAAIGGKTGMNTPAGKNLVGAFYSPKSVCIDFSLLKTLPKREIQAGMAEVIKCGFISDPQILELVIDYEANIEELIERSIQVKADVVSVDFKEGKLREILNYGHTLGHAIEKRENYKWRHGEAISIGLVFAAELGQICAGLDREIVDRHRSILTRFDLPVAYQKMAFEELLGYMSNDKKSRNSKLRFIAISKLGEPVWLEEVTSDQIALAYERICT